MQRHETCCMTLTTEIVFQTGTSMVTRQGWGAALATLTVKILNIEPHECLQDESAAK